LAELGANTTSRLLAENELVPTEEIQCSWFRAGPSVVQAITTPAPQAAPESNVVVIVPEDFTLVNPEYVEPSVVMVSFTISGLKEVTTSTFQGVNDACEDGLQRSFINTPVYLWNVSMQLTPETCDMRVGVTTSMSVARFAEMLKGLETSLEMGLFREGFRDADVTMDRLPEAVPHVMSVPAECSEGHDGPRLSGNSSSQELSHEGSDNAVGSMMSNALLMILIFLQADV
jgi:hypothetical protein